MQVNEKVYPTETYASLIWVVIVFIVTDYLRYKPIIILDGLAGVMTYVLLLELRSTGTEFCWSHRQYLAIILECTCLNLIAVPQINDISTI